MSAAHLLAPAPSIAAVHHQGCTSKVMYVSRADAMRDVRRARTVFRPYRCRSCKGWHLTSLGEHRP